MTHRIKIHKFPVTTPTEDIENTINTFLEDGHWEKAAILLVGMAGSQEIWFICKELKHNGG